jgi:predicted MFS family arabinose efflux permease
VIFESTIGLPRVLLLLMAIGAMGVGVTFLSVTRSIPVLAAGGLIIGFASAGTILPGQTLIQEMTPVGLFGRVFSIFGSLATTSRILGMPLAGVIASLTGVLNVYRAVGIAMIGLAIAGFAMAPRFRALRTAGEVGSGEVLS